MNDPLEPDEAHRRKTRAFRQRVEASFAAEARILAERAEIYAEAFAYTQERTAKIPSATSRERDMPLRAMAAELGPAVHVDDRTMQTHLFEGHRLHTEFTATWEAWRDGKIQKAHTRVIVEFGAELHDPAARAAYEKDVLAYAVKTTAGRVKPYAQQVADKLNPATVQERHDVAVCKQRVFVEDLPDGMSMLGVIGPSSEIHGIYDRTTQQGREIKATDLRARREAAGQPVRDEGEPVWFDERGLDEIRADVLMDMLLTAAPTIDPTGGGLGAIRATVQVSIPATTLAGTTSGGAELNGKCAIDPTTVRILTGNAPGFDRVFLHPVTAEVLTTDRYTPTAGIRRFLQARYVRCAFPGCRRPAMRSEIDHHQEYSKGGKTKGDNLGPCCTRHHVTRHAAGWTVEQLPGGRLRFTAPSGAVYIEDPPPRVMFLPDPEPEPEPELANAPF
ncbi:HNH endonuclease signature motif containing protein [Microbacterium aurantiacum]|uniref:HNH endonuclease n=1 Tax=Microbacterium aurantiacum TaxID=162393 RepID=A0ABT8FTQ5_9MICO|nr:HNH endonuclease signature motif containing protein [Microbacterium aurantiacum]MDN4464686.1 HNH endonuclease [Microbacterium aurantiacum]